MRRSGILLVLRTALTQREEVLEAYVFGSEARGTGAPHSDIDIAVYVDPMALERPGFGYEAELSAALMAALRNNGVDVVVLNGAPPLLYHRVLRDGERLLSRDLRATGSDRVPSNAPRPQNPITPPSDGSNTGPLDGSMYKRPRFS